MFLWNQVQRNLFRLGTSIGPGSDEDTQAGIVYFSLMDQEEVNYQSSCLKFHSLNGTAIGPAEAIPMIPRFYDIRPVASVDDYKQIDRKVYYNVNMYSNCVFIFLNLQVYLPVFIHPFPVYIILYLRNIFLCGHCYIWKFLFALVDKQNWTICIYCIKTSIPGFHQIQFKNCPILLIYISLHFISSVKLLGHHTNTHRHRHKKLLL